jgi:general secretion pathway protein M
MMMPALSPPISKALALTLLVCVVAVAYFGVVQPLIESRRDQQGQIERLEDSLVRYRRVAEQRSSREGELAELKRRAADADGLLRGANETLMAAAIQNRIKALVDAAHGELKSMQILPPQADGPLRRITVRGQIAMTMEGAERVFYDLEGSEPALFLDNVGIRSREDARRRRDRGEDGMLEVHLDVYGYAQPQP